MVALPLVARPQQVNDLIYRINPIQQWEAAYYIAAERLVL